MNKPSLHLVVMAGGSGTRFWPKSTSQRPKQLLSFGKDTSETLLVHTLKRFDGLVPPGVEHRTIVTTRQLKHAVGEQAPDVAVLAEPAGRNTAPCVYWAARAIFEKDPRAVMLVMPSDHYIADLASFKRSVMQAAEWASSHDDLVTLGVKPSRPETGYGYLRLGAPVAGSAGPATHGDCRKVEAFVEKPKFDKAREFVESGNYLWNGGMFLWRAEVILKAFAEFMPEMDQVWNRSDGKVEVAYPQMTATSIDYGVMEKAKNVVTFTLDCGWDDLGSWTSLESLSEVLEARHECGVLTGGQVISVDSTGNIVDAPGKLIALLGVENLIVVQHGNAILVARKDRAQDIKLIVEQVKKKRPELA
ncbi:MAG: mannose-1-phosphate guanylyltransferase [Methylotenera sp.]|nr:mannose-1-phosphate guanylyltransferase [Oligoflexia bacterium]